MQAFFVLRGNIMVEKKAAARGTDSCEKKDLYAELYLGGYDRHRGDLRGPDGQY